MPIYEYVSQSDGERIELLRPMAAADDPVDDPKGKGRVFKRVQSTFASKGGASSLASPSGGGGSCCPCGKNSGGCSNN